MEELNRWHAIFIKTYKQNLKGKNILDLGCGKNVIFIETLFKEGINRYVGIDPDKQSLEILKSSFKDKIEEGNLILIKDLVDENLIVRIKDVLLNTKPDFITSFEVIEHIANPHPFVQGIINIAKFIKEINSQVKVILSTPNAFNIKRLFYYCILQKYNDPLMDVANNKNPEHIRGYSYRIIKELLKNYGFKNIKFLSCKNIPYFLCRYFTRNIVVEFTV
jgi:2-polyprenyl-3-methyl-5-hydroxy-6-metoxy-1,4-benzoquinol methylase